MRVLVKSPLNQCTGYGNDGIGLVRALLAAGLDVYLEPTGVRPPLPPAVAALLTKTTKAPFDLLIHHAEPVNIGLTPQGRQGAPVAVAWTMWEQTTFDTFEGRDTFAARLARYDLVCAYDSVSYGALAPHVGSDRLVTLQGGYTAEDWPPAQRNWHADPFSFCMVGRLSERKDPFVAINAFRELKDEHPDFTAELHLKTTIKGLHPAMADWLPGLHIHCDEWAHDELYAFYRRNHVLLAPSRGEGKNLPALEMLSTGGTVIATNWGGHTQWLHPAYAYPLDFTLAPVAPDLPDCQVAHADKDQLKQTMLHLFRNRDEASLKGRAATTLLPAMCSWPTVVDRLFTRINDQLGAGHLLDEFRRSREAAHARGGLIHA